MKMLGVVAEYNKEEGYGYIKGGDDTLYLFISLLLNDIKEGNLVKFVPNITDIPYASDIEILNNIFKD